MMQIIGFKRFLKEVEKRNISIEWERVKKPNWSVFYCVYANKTEDLLPLNTLAYLYNSTQWNKSYINVYDKSNW
jgi:hypothetical protein